MVSLRGKRGREEDCGRRLRCAPATAEARQPFVFPEPGRPASGAAGPAGSGVPPGTGGGYDHRHTPHPTGGPAPLLGPVPAGDRPSRRLATPPDLARPDPPPADSHRAGPPGAPSRVLRRVPPPARGGPPADSRPPAHAHPRHADRPAAVSH